MGTAGKVVIGLIVVGGVVVGVYYFTRPADKPAVKPTKAGGNSDVSDVSGAVKSGFDFLSSLVKSNLGHGAQSNTKMPQDYSGGDNFKAGEENYAPGATDLQMPSTVGDYSTLKSDV